MFYHFIDLDKGLVLMAASVSNQASLESKSSFAEVFSS